MVTKTKAPVANEKISKSNTGKGGARVGAGRKKGAPNKRTQEIMAKVEATGITPLDYMLNILRTPDLPANAKVMAKIAHNNMRFEAAKAAAPYVHAKLASVEHKGVGKDGAIIIQTTPTDEKL